MYRQDLHWERFPMRAIVVGLLVLLAGCGDATGPAALDVQGAVRYESPLHASMWAVAEDCSGLRGDFSRIRFYTAAKIILDGQELRGLWWPATNTIYLLDAMKDNPTAIEHEEMHALLRSREGEEIHPAQYFVSGPCGNLMVTWW
jgi:hypothetical protein